MKVVRERPCQRRHHRVTAPLDVRLGESKHHYRASNWSLGGLRLDGVAAPLPMAGDEIQLNLVLPFQGFDIGFDLHARVVRTQDTDGTVAFEFTDVPERSRDLMSHFIEDLIRGQMGTFEDAICRIDVPVTPISTDPDPNPSSAVPVPRWPLKTILMSAFYILLGSAVFGYGGLLAYSSMMRLEVQTAVVSVPLQTLKMPVDGVLLSMRYGLGARVERGDLIAEIEDPKLAAQIAAAQSALKDAQDRHFRSQEKYRIEAERLKLYQTINKTDLDVAKARLAARQVDLAAADAHFRRIAKLHGEGFANTQKLDEAKARQLRAAAGVRELEVKVAQTVAMHAVSHKRHYNHKEFVVDLDMLALELDESHSELKSAERKLALLQDTQKSRAIRAPFSGHVVSLPQVAGVSVAKGQTVLVLEQDVAPTVTAYLDQDEILKVGLDDAAKIFLPALNRHVQARVIAINRRSGYLDLKGSQYTWKSSGERTAAVQLKLLGTAYPERKISAGLPAVVIFDRRITNDLVAKLTSFTAAITGGSDA